MLFSNIVSFFLLEFIVLLSSLLFLGFVGAREFSSWLVLSLEVLPPCILSCLPMWMVAIQRDIFLRYKIGLLRLKTLFIPLGIYPFGARPPARGDFFGVPHSVSLSELICRLSPTTSSPPHQVADSKWRTRSQSVMATRTLSVMATRTLSVMVTRTGSMPLGRGG